MTRFIVPILLLLALAFAIAGSADERYPRAVRRTIAACCSRSRGPRKKRARGTILTRASRTPSSRAKSSSSSIAPNAMARTRAGHGRAMNLHLSAVQNATPGELEWFLRNGNLWRGMPSWSGLPEQRRWQIVAYLKSLRH